MSSFNRPKFSTEAMLDEAVKYLDETSRHACVMLNIIRDDVAATIERYQERFVALDNRYHNHSFTLERLKGNVAKTKKNILKSSPHPKGFVIAYNFSVEMEDVQVVQKTFDFLLKDITILKEKMEKVQKEKPKPDIEELDDEEPAHKRRKTKGLKDNDDNAEKRESTSGGKHYVRSVSPRTYLNILQLLIAFKSTTARTHERKSLEDAESLEG